MRNLGKFITRASCLFTVAMPTWNGMAIATFLADRFRVAALDLSGNGNSDWRERYSGELFAQEVWAVCEAVQLVPRPFVIGHSFGGSLL